MTTTRFLKLIAALLALLAAVPAAAQQYPNRAIRVIVGFPPGGTSPSLIKLDFDPVKDFAFVTLVAESQNPLVVHPLAAGEKREGAERAFQSASRRHQLRFLGHQRKLIDNGRTRT